MLALAERLPRDRFTVDFVTLSGAGEYDTRAEAAGARVRSLGSGTDPNAGRVVRGWRRASKIIRYAALARSARYDIIDAWLYPADVLAALARPLCRTPVVIAGRRNIDPQDQFGRLEDPVGALVRRWTDMIVANSAAVAAHAIAHQGIDPAKVRVIRNGVEVREPVTRGERALARRALGARDDEILVGCIANYRDVKRLDLLVDAFGALVRAGFPVRLELIGEGPMRSSLEHQVRTEGLAELVCLHGAVPDVAPLYAGLDVVVQSSEREGLPNALLEAGAAGRAIVATDAGGSSEIVIDGETGLLVPVGDAVGLASSIRRMVTDTYARQRLGSAARSHVARAFGMDRFVAEFAQLYETLAEERGVRP